MNQEIKTADMGCADYDYLVSEQAAMVDGHTVIIETIRRHVASYTYGRQLVEETTVHPVHPARTTVAALDGLLRARLWRGEAVRFTVTMGNNDHAWSIVPGSDWADDMENLLRKYGTRPASIDGQWVHIS